MRTHRRPLVTAAVAGGLLCGLWFVPSANATGDGASARSATLRTGTQSGTQTRTQHQDEQPRTDVRAVRAQVGTNAHDTSGRGVELADTGSFDTTPYLAGGLGFLGAGAALLAHARIRSGREGLTPTAR